MNGVDRADQLRSYYNTQRRKCYKTWKPLWHFLLDVATTNSYLLGTRPPPGEPKRCPKSHAQFLKDLASGLFRHSKRAPKISTIDANRKVFDITPLHALVQKTLDASQHRKVKLSENKTCRACAAANRFAEPTTRRKDQGDLSANTLRGTAKDNEGRASRIKRSRWGCEQCNINLCRNGPCWMEHIEAAFAEPEEST
jgi:hypothetical protein